MAFSPEYVYALDIESDTTINGLDPRVAAITSIALADAEETAVFTGEEREILLDTQAWLSDRPAGLLTTWNGAVFDLPFISDRAITTGLLARESGGIVGDHFGLVIEPDAGLVPKYEPTPGHEGGYRGWWYRVGAPGAAVRTGCDPHVHLDVCFAYRRWAAEQGVSWSLKPVAKALGFTPVEVDRERMHELTDEELRAYNASDAVITRALALRILGLD